MTRDFTPLFRTAIGFDRLAQVVDGLQEAASSTFPPYNIEKTGMTPIASPSLSPVSRQTISM